MHSSFHTSLMPRCAVPSLRMARTARRFLAALLFLVSSGAFADTAPADEPFATLDEYAERARLQWKVPGLSIAIVKDGEVVLARGYGICKTGEQSRVTKDTLFHIGSCTKSFTATAIGQLVDTGKLKWDDPVRQHLPDFELYDPFLTRETTIRDLLAHRIGLELADLLWSKNEFTSDEIMGRLRHVRPKRSFRSRFSYNNLMYLVAGRVVEKVSGQPWDEFIRESIVNPLRMQSTTFAFPSDQTIAWPHGEVHGEMIPFEADPNYSSAIAPAGSIWSNATDIAEWLRANLPAGDTGTEPLIRPDTLREMHSPQAIIPVRRTRYPRKRYASSGLGWFVEDYRGRKLVRNGGARNGFIAWIGMLPSERFGFAIFANSHRTGINFALHHRILDEFLGEPAKDWSTIVLNDYTSNYYRMLRESRINYAKKRQTGTKPALPLPKYSGTYRNDLFGDLSVREVDDGLELQFGPRRIGLLEHWQHNTFEANFHNPVVEDWHVTFEVTDDAQVTSVTAVAAPWAMPWYDDATVVGQFNRVRNPE